MKLKRLPEDFLVEELTDVVPTQGDYALYRMTKTSLGTPEAVDRIVSQLKIQRHRISYGGLKDKHARTTQFLTIRFGAPRDSRLEQVELRYLGQIDTAFTPQHIAGNRFQLRIRDLSAEGVARAENALAEVARWGVPNYFDDQRFGSLGDSGEFVGRAWCLGDFERALWLALADPHVEDRRDDREQKEILRQHWGNWPACKQALSRSHRRSIVTYLADKPPDCPDYRGAFARIRVDLRGLYLSAFQSQLWNQLLAGVVAELAPPEQQFAVALKPGPVPFHRAADPAAFELWREGVLPLPSARLHLPPGPLLERVEEVVARHGLPLRELRVKYPRDSFFSKGDRPALLWPRELSSAPGSDPLYPGRRLLGLSFVLPRGAYATMLVKRITEC